MRNLKKKLKRVFINGFFLFLMVYSLGATAYILEMRKTFKEFKALIQENSQIIREWKEKEFLPRILDGIRK